MKIFRPMDMKMMITGISGKAGEVEGDNTLTRVFQVYQAVLQQYYHRWRKARCYELVISLQTYF